MSKDSKIGKIPPLNGTGEGMRQDNNTHSGLSSTANHTNPDQTTPPPQNRLNNDFGVDKFDTFFGSQDFAFDGKRPKNWQRIDRESEVGKTTKFFYQSSDLPYIIDLIPAQDGEGGGLTIKTNPSKNLHDWELTQDGAKIFDLFRDISTDLEKQGIHIDLQSGRVNRIDLAKNMLLEHPLYAYNQVFDTLKGKRQTKKAFGDTRYWGNNEHQLTIYNKSLELSIAGKLYKDQPQITRSEVRCLKNRSVAKICGINFIGDILNKKNFEEEYNFYVSDKILRNKYATQLLIDFRDMEQTFEGCINYFGKRKAFQQFIGLFGLEFLASTPHGITYLLELSRKNFSERTSRRHHEQINNTLNLLRTIKKQDTEITFTDLNHELRTKILVA